MKPERDAERAESKAIADTKHRAAVLKARLRWRQEGYRPMRHLEVATGDGDPMLMVDMTKMERRREREFGAWLAACDLYDIVSWICRRPSERARQQIGA